MNIFQKIAKIWKNKWMIFEGFKNTVSKKDDIEAVAAGRLIICSDCPLFDMIGDSCVVPGTQPCCKACGCCMKVKSRAMSAECAHPDGPKWKAEMSVDEQDKLYEKLDYDPEK